MNLRRKPIVQLGGACLDTPSPVVPRVGALSRWTWKRPSRLCSSFRKLADMLQRQFYIAGEKALSAAMSAGDSHER